MEAIDLAALAKGEIEVLARAITALESSEESALLRAKLASVALPTYSSIGITGSPGVGKSTLTSLLVSRFRKHGERVAVLAVDPSSALTGGALLGDRIRMQEHYLDSSVFIRSMSARGHLGGLAKATPDAISLVALAGFTTVILETVGVGQSEVEVMNHVDSTIILLAPGAGDDIQSAKAGILEIGDIFLINKVDRDRAGAGKLRDEILRSNELSPRADGWKAPVLLISALEREGIDEVVIAIENHQKFSR